MAPDSDTPTRWEVSVMITNAITDYDRKQETRHRENSEKLDRNAAATIALEKGMGKQFGEIQQTLNEAVGARKLTAWVIPIILSVLAIAAEVVRFLK